MHSLNDLIVFSSADNCHTEDAFFLSSSIIAPSLTQTPTLCV